MFYALVQLVMPCAVGDMHLRLLLLYEERVDALPLTPQNKPSEADRLSIASPCPPQLFPASDAGRKPASYARGCRFTQGKGWQCGRVRPCLCFIWPPGGWGALAGKRPHISREATTARQDIDPARPCSKKRRGDAIPAPFCCPSPEVMDVDLVATFTRKVQDITASYANPKGGRFYRRTRFA